MHAYVHTYKCTYSLPSPFPLCSQSYSAAFEAIPDGAKGRGLTFEVQGEGNLPQVAIAKPSLRNAKGHPLLLFRRLLLSQLQTLPVVLQNTGTIPAIVLVETASGSQAFKVSPVDDIEEVEEPDDLATNLATQVKPEAAPSSDRPSSGRKSTKRSSKSLPPLPVRLGVGETKEFLVTFHPHATKKCRGELCLRIQHNQFETLPVQLVGEGYEDEVCIENIRGHLEEPLAALTEGVQELPEDIDGKYIRKSLQ